MKFWNIFKTIIELMLCISLVLLACAALLETKDYIELQKNTRPYIYRQAEYYGVNDDGRYLISDEIGYVWIVQVQIDKGYHYLIKVSLGEDYYSRGDDVLESLWVKIQ